MTLPVTRRWPSGRANRHGAVVSHAVFREEQRDGVGVEVAQLDGAALGDQEPVFVDGQRLLVGPADAAVEHPVAPRPAAQPMGVDVDLGREVADRLGSVGALRRIDRHDPAAARTVVVGRRGDHLVRAGNRLGVHERARRDHAVAVEAGQPRAVRVDRPEALDRAGRPVDVFPAGVDDPPVVEHRGREVHQVVGRQPLLLRAVALHAVQNRRGDHVAVGIGRFAVGDERDAAVGQPARVEVVVRAVGQLRQAGAVDVDLEDLVVALFVCVARNILDVGHRVRADMPAAPQAKTTSRPSYDRSAVVIMPSPASKIHFSSPPSSLGVKMYSPPPGRKPSTW